MARQIIQVVADVPAGPGGAPAAQRIVNAFDVSTPTAAADIGGTLLQVIGGQGLKSGDYVTITVTVMDLVNVP